MTLPSSDNYTFEEELTVSVGDPTEAEAHFNASTENTDYLKETKLTGWRGSCDNSGERVSNKNSTGSLWVARVTGQATNGSNPYHPDPISLADVSALGVPTESGGFKHRLLLLSFAAVWAGGQAVPSFQDRYDVTQFLPTLDANNELSRHLAGDSTEEIDSNGLMDPGTDWNKDSSLIRAEPFWPGGGQSAYDADVYVRTFTWGACTLYFWVDDTTGDLRFTFEGPIYTRMTLHGVVLYGPVWEETT